MSKALARSAGTARSETFWLVMAVALSLRLIYAAGAPLSNDESYYWDWARGLQLSFLDHPPGVAWLGWLSRWLFSGALAARGVIPFVHVLAVWFLLRCTALIKGSRLTNGELWTLLALTELVPAFSFEGLLLLPDAGLLLALGAALYCFVKAAKAYDLALGVKRWPWLWALLGGVAIGLAGLFKYHAAPVAMGLGFGLLAYWGVHRWRVWLGWILLCAAVALLVASPVWIWNAQHEWASLRFQGDHGFGGLRFDLVPALRVFFGQVLLLTPYVMIRAVRSSAWRSDYRLERLAQAAFWPLFLLLEGLAFGKQMLPHWIAPAFWLMLPGIALQAQRGWLWRGSMAFSSFITLILPWFLVLAPLRQGIIDAAHGKPGPLSELTLWRPLVDALVAEPRLQEALLRRPAEPAAASSCATPLIASLRWFWTSQLAFHLPGQPRVLSFDFNHPSYYAFRDDLESFGGCAVLLIGDERHFNPEQIAEVLVPDHQERLPLVVPSHQDTTLVVIKGHMRSAAELANVRRRYALAGGLHP